MSIAFIITNFFACVVCDGVGGCVVVIVFFSFCFSFFSLLLLFALFSFANACLAIIYFIGVFVACRVYTYACYIQYTSLGSMGFFFSVGFFFSYSSISIVYMIYGHTVIILHLINIDISIADVTITSNVDCFAKCPNQTRFFLLCKHSQNQSVFMQINRSN